MELGVSHEQSLSSSTPIVDNIFDKYNKTLVPIRSLSDHDISTPDYGPALKIFTTKDPSSVPKKPRYSLRPKTEYI